MAAKWLADESLAFDVETTGVDVFNDRIVTACAVTVSKRGAQFRGRWLLNPGVPIPPEATAIHGITDEKARGDGADPVTVLPAIRQTLMDASAMNLPLIIMNAHFDLTMLQRELERFGFPPLVIGPVLDPLVIDRAIDQYRKGSRKLDALARHYGVEQTGAHSSDGDALTAARVIWRMASHPKAPQLDLTAMQAWQAEKHAEWAGQFEIYLRSKGKPEVINRVWPVRRAAE